MDKDKKEYEIFSYDNIEGIERAKQRQFGGKNVILSSLYDEVLQKCRRVKTTWKSRTRKQFWRFSISRKAQLPAIKITEQPILLTRRKINRPGYKCSKYFR